jgi:hypothetical protein
MCSITHYGIRVKPSCPWKDSTDKTQQNMNNTNFFINGV